MGGKNKYIYIIFKNSSAIFVFPMDYIFKLKAKISLDKMKI